MRQNPIRREATCIRFVCTALCVLGIALVDRSVVWTHTPVSLPPWHESGSLVLDTSGCRTAEGAVAPLDAVAGATCAGTSLLLSSCFTSDCRPGASLMGTSRPYAAMARFTGRVGIDALESADLHAHRVMLLALAEPWAPFGQEPRAASGSPRPARLAGADRSIPWPPPG